MVSQRRWHPACALSILRHGPAGAPPPGPWRHKLLGLWGLGKKAPSRADFCTVVDMVHIDMVPGYRGHGALALGIGPEPRRYVVAPPPDPSPGPDHVAPWSRPVRLADAGNMFGPWAPSKSIRRGVAFHASPSPTSRDSSTPLWHHSAGSGGQTLQPHQLPTPTHFAATSRPKLRAPQFQP